MTSEKVYLDANILIGYIHKKHKNNQEITECLTTMELLDLSCYYSYWSVIETERVLIKDYGYSSSGATKKVLNLIEKTKLKNIPLKLIGLKDSYTSNDLLWLIREARLSNDVHLTDTIHSLIMSQNRIKTILTTDTDFQVIKEINVLLPKNVSLMKPKKLIKHKAKK